MKYQTNRVEKINISKTIYHLVHHTCKSLIIRLKTLQISIINLKYTSCFSFQGIISSIFIIYCIMSFKKTKIKLSQAGRHLGTKVILVFSWNSPKLILIIFTENKIFHNLFDVYILDGINTNLVSVKINSPRSSVYIERERERSIKISKIVLNSCC